MGTALDRIVVRMDGWPGAPGFMTFYVNDGTTGQPAVLDFINAVKSSFDSHITFTVPGEGDIIDDASGVIQGTWTVGSPTTVSGTGNQQFAAPAGACITWSTGTIVNGRRLRGRTFLVPLIVACYDADGTIGGATLTALRNAASALWVAADLKVWHRPTAPGALDGSSAAVSGSTVSDRVSILSSRRA